MTNRFAHLSEDELRRLLWGIAPAGRLEFLRARSRRLYSAMDPEARAQLEQDVRVTEFTEQE